MPLFACTALLSAALLFAVQPMIAKALLPRLGGTPQVWNTCMVFFQACLLAGYAYAHYAPRWLGQRRHALAHLLILCLPLLALPLALRGGPMHSDAPIRGALAALALSVGLPFVVVAATAPLLQTWYASGAREPYFLYAASNLGSFAALLAYPRIIDRYVPLGQQMRWWSAGYLLLAALIAACALRYALSRASVSERELRHPIDRAEKPTARQRWRWIALALVPSSYMLGVTTFITSDIAAIPLLWVLPLALYLLSFVLVFGRFADRLRKPFLYGLPVMALAAGLLLLLRIANPLAVVLGVHLLAFFCAAMVCHGELARTRPPAEQLTDFYLMIAVGGVLGGAFNALLAPLIFRQPLEYPLAMALACALSPPIGKREDAPSSGLMSPRMLDVVLPLAVGISAGVAVILNRSFTGSMPISVIVLNLLVLCAILCITFIPRPHRFAAGLAALLAVAVLIPAESAQVLQRWRSYFGVQHVQLNEQPRVLQLHHGGTVHGRQKADAMGHPISPLTSLTYYHRTGPIGDLLTRLPPDRATDIAAIGLGVGSIAAYAGPRMRMTFYEIDPTVRWAAEESGYFSYLSAARGRGADIKIVIGDARLTVASASPASLDVVVVDAFSGDAIPTHLLTREALVMYLDRLRPDGVLMVHISNIYLDLEPVVANLAGAAGCEALARHDLQIDDAEAAEGKVPSQWVAIGKSPAALAPLRSVAGWKVALADHSVGTWSDDFSNVLGTFRWWRAPG